MMNYQPKSLLKYDVCCFSLFSNKTNKLKTLSLVAALVPFNFPFTRTDCIFSILLISRTDFQLKRSTCVFSGIRQLQLILLKMSLLLGVEVHTGVEFQSLVEPSGENGIYFHLFSTCFAQYIIITCCFLFISKAAICKAHKSLVCS